MNKRKTKNEFSKKLALFVLICAEIEILLTYILAFIGMPEIAETVAVALVTEVIGVYGLYALKAYLGKKAEEELKYKRDYSEFFDINKEQKGDPE